METVKYESKENILERCVSDCERAVIIQALMKTRGNQSAAAILLGTTKRILTYKVNKYGIDCEQLKDHFVKSKGL